MSPGVLLRLFLDSNVLTARLVSSWGLEKAMLSLLRIGTPYAFFQSLAGSLT